MNSILEEKLSPTQVRDSKKLKVKTIESVVMDDDEKERGTPKQRRLDLTGLRYGMLTVVGFDHIENFITYWKAVCDCGGTKVVRTNSLRTGRANSCGCLRGKGGVTHGQTKTKEYRAWVSIKTRCNNPNTINFKHYGGKGIKVCERWLSSFQRFLTDMGKCPSPGHSIERKKSNGNYEPSNCYWATRKEQNNNTSQNRYIEYNGETKTIAQWCDLLNLKYDTVYNRLASGDSVERAFRPTHKFCIGDEVIFFGSVYTIAQRRIEWGLPYYRLSSGRIVAETILH